MKVHHYVFILAVLAYVATAFFSVGYFHPDEHYQVIEFAGILDGTNQPGDLAWEYEARIRPALQPIIAYVIFRVCDFFQISDSYSQAFVLRLLTALLSLCVIFNFAESLRAEIPKGYWTLFLILTYFLWFLPSVNVRFSSEAWSGMFLLLSATIVIKGYRTNASYAILGGLLGLSFLFRFQIAFSVVCMFLWLFFIRKEQVSKWIMGAGSFVMVVALGVLVDSWYYGEWVVAPWNYFIVTLIDGKGSLFGILPWYYYPVFILRFGILPIGAVILLSLLLLVFARHKNIIVWLVVPFIIGHSVIGHKELRFLFPLINLVPFILIMALDIVSLDKWNSFLRNSVKATILALLAINTVALVVACAKPAGLGRVSVTEIIHKVNTQKRLAVIYAFDYNPYSPWGLTTHFYKEPNLSLTSIDSYLSKEEMALDPDTRTVLVVAQSDVEAERIQRLIQGHNMREIGKNFPNFILPFLRLYGYKADDIWVVYAD